MGSARLLCRKPLVETEVVQNALQTLMKSGAYRGIRAALWTQQGRPEVTKATGVEPARQRYEPERDAQLVFMLFLRKRGGEECLQHLRCAGFNVVRPQAAKLEDVFCGKGISLNNRSPSHSTAEHASMSIAE